MMQQLKRKRVLIPLLLGIYLVALLALMPARVVLWFAPLPQEVAVGGISGTIWNGTIARVRVDNVALNDVSWRVRAWDLLRLRVTADLDIPARQDNVLQGNGRISVTSGGALAIHNLRLAGELDELMGLMPFDSPIPLRGALTANVSEFVLGQPICQQFDGRIIGVQLQARLAQGWDSLGDYEVNLGCSEGRIDVLMEPDNLLGLSVTGSVAPTSTELRIGIAPQPGAPRGINDLLQWLGEADAQGRRYFNFRL
ncbi:type II secretion system protein N [Aliidiomarina halalkaliphila]|uniref:Type II secretion system protein N n=1 Tax=Aliidiomarina halalkaliphila TaxID=2593535 RepID=A0A552X5P7_9GAMM|nr:type II secretion system protein N [Aliidiomarina halalkaliphila]TRW50306.1 type II secretion system protein N [Aliidiomarina halalkaliphila]